MMIIFPKGQIVTATHRGKIELLFGTIEITPTSVYYIEGMITNIVSYSRLDEKGVKTKISNGVCSLTDRKDAVTFARLSKRNSDGLFVVQTQTDIQQQSRSRTKGSRANIADPKVNVTLHKSSMEL